MNKEFEKYADAYALYSEILSGRDTDRKNPTITYVETPLRTMSCHFVVWWEAK
jgi:hypothetical protein